MDAHLLVAVIAEELEEEALRIAAEEGVRGGTVLPGRGIGFPELVTFYGLTYRGLERIILWVIDSVTANRLAARLNTELELLHPFRGLAFTLALDGSGGIDPAAIRAAIEQERGTK